MKQILKFITIIASISMVGVVLCWLLRESGYIDEVLNNRIKTIKETKRTEKKKRSGMKILDDSKFVKDDGMRVEKK